MYLEVTTPSKTFLLGEYLALNGGPALLLNTSPRFSLIVESNTTGKADVRNIPPGSPSAKYISSHADFFKDLKITFLDPYQGIGGFGASSAQFCMLAALHYYVQKKTINIPELIAEYQRFCWDGQGIQPSGVDIVSQLHGQMIYFHKNNFEIKKFDWPFESLNFYLLHTYNKIPTHEHLKKLKNVQFSELQGIAGSMLKNLEDENEEKFCALINEYQQQLEKMQLSNPMTQDLLKEIRKSPAVLAAKGCGALGADVILALVRKTEAGKFLNFIKNIKVKLINSDNKLSEGVSIKEKNSRNEQVIVVNEKDQQIGLEEKLLAHQKGILHRAFSVFVFRSNHQQVHVLLQQRSKRKYHTPGLWTNACCSHPHPEEDILRSAQRRLEDEMGLKISLQEVGVFRYKAIVGQELMEHEIDHVFIGQYTTEEIHPNPVEVADYRWVEINRLRGDLEENPKIYTPWLKQALDLAINSGLFKQTFNLKV